MSGVAGNAFRLQQSWQGIQIKSQLEVHRRVVELSRRLYDVVQVDRVVKAREVGEACDRVDALMFADLSFEHSAHCNGQAVPLGPGLVPGEVLVERDLPLLDVSFAVGVPDPVEAGRQCYWPLHFAVLGDENHIGVAELSGKQSTLLHLGEQGCQSGDCWVWQVADHAIGNAIRSSRFVG